jgi:hypothetical protein
MAEPRPPAPGVLDSGSWPDQLSARAIEVTPGAIRIHGYDVLTDLARHYELSDVLYLAIVGELPDERAAQLYRLAMTASMPMSIGEAPCHAAVVSRVCAASLASAIGVGAIALAGQSQQLIDRHAPLLAWITRRDGGDMPTEFRAEPSPWVAALVAAARSIDPAVELHLDMTRDAASIALLFAAGLTKPDQLVAAMMVARMFGIIAEVATTGPEHFADYPVDVPRLRYAPST